MITAVAKQKANKGVRKRLDTKNYTFETAMEMMS